MGVSCSMWGIVALVLDYQLLTKLFDVCGVVLSVLLAYRTTSYSLSQLGIWSKICVFSCDAHFKLYKRIKRTNYRHSQRVSGNNTSVRFSNMYELIPKSSMTSHTN